MRKVCAVHVFIFRFPSEPVWTIAALVKVNRTGLWFGLHHGADHVWYTMMIVLCGLFQNNTLMFSGKNEDNFDWDMKSTAQFRAGSPENCSQVWPVSWLAVLSPQNCAQAATRLIQCRMIRAPYCNTVNIYRFLHSLNQLVEWYDDRRIANDLGRSVHGLIGVLSHNFPGGTEENHRTPQSG
jgi:hypothetical protein